MAMEKFFDPLGRECGIEAFYEWHTASPEGWPVVNL